MKQTETNPKQILFQFVSVRTKIYFCSFRGHPSLQLANLHAQLAGIRLLLLLAEHVLLALLAERGGEFVDARLQFVHAFRAQGPFSARQKVRCVPRLKKILRHTVARSQRES
jgi:hypothetical protein